MARLNASNNAKTLLTSDVDDSETKFKVGDSSGFPNAPFRLSLGNEIVEVTEVDGDTFRVERGVEGTDAESHDEGTSVENRFTSGTYDELETREGAQDKSDDAEKAANEYTDEKLDEYSKDVSDNIDGLKEDLDEREKKDNLSSVATSGKYDDLSGKPDLDFAGKDDFDELSKAYEEHEDDDGNPHEVTKSQVGLSDVKNTEQASKKEFDELKDDVKSLGDEVDEREKKSNLSSVATSGSYDDLTDKPDEFKPESHEHDIDDIKDLKDDLDEREKKDNLSSVATSGEYDDLSGKPDLNFVEKDEFESHVNDYLPHDDGMSQYSSEKDDDGIYTVVEYRRDDDTLYLKSILSDQNSDDHYETVTWKFYDSDGSNVEEEIEWEITYDSDGQIESKVIS